jgi:recombinational DNA repair protein (RecF pathway)
MLELFNQVFLQAARTPGIDVITEVKLLTDYSSFSQNFGKTQIAFRIIELIIYLKILYN